MAKSSACLNQHIIIQQHHVTLNHLRVLVCKNRWFPTHIRFDSCAGKSVEATSCLDVATEIKKVVLVLQPTDLLLQTIRWKTPSMGVLGRYWRRKAYERPN